MSKEYFDFEENTISQLDMVSYINQLDAEVKEMMTAEYGSIDAYVNDFVTRNEHMKDTYRLFERLVSCRPWEQLLICQRYGLIDGVPKTLDEVAKLLGISRERALQIEKKCLKPTCRIQRTHRIRDYLRD